MRLAEVLRLHDAPSCTASKEAKGSHQTSCDFPLFERFVLVRKLAANPTLGVVGVAGASVLRLIPEAMSPSAVIPIRSPRDHEADRTKRGTLW